MTSYTLEEDFFESIFAPDKSTEQNEGKTEDETPKINTSVPQKPEEPGAIPEYLAYAPPNTISPKQLFLPSSSEPKKPASTTSLSHVNQSVKTDTQSIPAQFITQTSLPSQNQQFQTLRAGQNYYPQPQTNVSMQQVSHLNSQQKGRPNDKPSQNLVHQSNVSALRAQQMRYFVNAPQPSNPPASYNAQVTQKGVPMKTQVGSQQQNLLTNHIVLPPQQQGPMQQVNQSQFTQMFPGQAQFLQTNSAQSPPKSQNQLLRNIHQQQNPHAWGMNQQNPQQSMNYLGNVGMPGNPSTQTTPLNLSQLGLTSKQIHPIPNQPQQQFQPTHTLQNPSQIHPSTQMMPQQHQTQPQTQPQYMPYPQPSPSPQMQTTSHSPQGFLPGNPQQYQRLQLQTQPSSQSPATEQFNPKKNPPNAAFSRSAAQPNIRPGVNPPSSMITVIRAGNTGAPNPQFLTNPNPNHGLNPSSPQMVHQAHNQASVPLNTLTQKHQQQTSSSQTESSSKNQTEKPSENFTEDEPELQINEFVDLNGIYDHTEEEYKNSNFKPSESPDPNIKRPNNESKPQQNSAEGFSVGTTPRMQSTGVNLKNVGNLSSGSNNFIQGAGQFSVNSQSTIPVNGSNVQSGGSLSTPAYQGMKIGPGPQMTGPLMRAPSPTHHLSHPPSSPLGANAATNPMSPPPTPPSPTPSSHGISQTQKLPPSSPNVNYIQPPSPPTGNLQQNNHQAHLISNGPKYPTIFKLITSSLA
eukprot:TRINITY_DN5814_c0_g1_i1.p1 TRINITY_DN5814_c0_g1~~TRINITY_DN5814_c0_g1_i1.p1  ORF type:complete len:754 (+),score=162.39 TRINITY_DN5814_c0_g1_i1:37-2262(+)